MLTDYPINSQVSVHITRFIPSGLLGQVEDGPRAIIRNRELAWGEPLPPKDYVGQTREAVVIGFNPAYRELELSLRLVDRDPWKEVASKYVPGSEVQGRVVGLTENGTFVELEPGVEGFLPVNELALDPKERIQDWLWIHDHVKALITRVNPHRRRLSLGLKDLLTRRDVRIRRQLWASHEETSSSRTTLAEFLPTETRLQLLRLDSAEEPLAPGPRLQVLIIEDDEAYGAGLGSLLQRNGCEVTLAEDGMTGLAHACTQSNPFDLILLDWNLPGLKGHEVVQQFQQESCPSRLVMVLEPAPLREHPEIWEVLRDSGVDVFSKVDVEGLKVGLISILRELRQDRSRSEELRRRHFPEIIVSSPRQQGSSLATEASLLLLNQGEGLQAILTQVCQGTQATSVMLMCLDPGRRRLVMEACVGKPFPLEQAPPDLIHSPLNNVLQKGEEVWEKITTKSSRFKRLLDLLPFQGFLGIPLPSVESSRYGLILLKERGSFGHRHYQEARLAAYLIAGVLQERRLTKTLQPWQAQNLVAQLWSSIVHEVNNKLGGIQLLADDLRERLGELARWPEKAEDATFLREIEQAVERIADAQKQASELRDRYLGLIATDEPQLVDLKVLIEEMIFALRGEAQQHNVSLVSELPSVLPPVRAQPSQLRQIFMNLMLNAIQQMAFLQRYGNLMIEVSHLPKAPLPLQVRFIDEGPGIHTQLCEHIFDFGFTTRKGGAGLGLTISRQAAASLGGKLQVEKSYMLWGTTFLLELPKGAQDE
jgi:signal transduction histidine kinase/predicted RNA-binding protein with RPS1 domain